MTADNGGDGAARAEHRSAAARTLLLALVIAYMACFTYLSLDRRDAMLCSLDYARIDSAAHNTAIGKFMWTNDAHFNFWSQHIAPILLFFSAFYLASDAYWFLFFAQTFTIAATAIPLFAIAARYLRNEWLALLVAVAYFSNGSLQIANLYDYHMMSHEPLFLFSAVYAALKRRWGWCFTFIVLLALCKEDGFVLSWSIALYLAMGLREYRKAFYTLAFCGVYALLVFKIGYPYLRSLEPYQYANYYAWMGNGPVEIAWNWIARPESLASWLLANEYLVKQWTGFIAQHGVILPLFSPLGLLMLMPPSMELLLASRSHLHGLTHHYPLLVVPIWTLAVVLSLSNIIKGVEWLVSRFRNGTLSRNGRGMAGRPAAVGLAAIILLCLIGVKLYYVKDYGALPVYSSWSAYMRSIDREHTAVAKKAAALVPRGTVVVTSPGMFAHLHHHTEAYISLQGYRPPLDGKNVEHLLLDMKDPQGKGRHQIFLIERLLLSRRYGAVFAEDGVFLFQRGGGKRNDHRLWMDYFTTSVVDGVPSFLSHLTGDVAEDPSSPAGRVVTARKNATQPGVLVYGPYLRLDRGQYIATFRMKVGERTEKRVASLDVSSRLGNLTHADRSLSGKDFKQANRWEEFFLPFTLTDAADKIELRVTYFGGADLSVDMTRIETGFETFRRNLPDAPAL